MGGIRQMAKRAQPRLPRTGCIFVTLEHVTAAQPGGRRESEGPHKSPHCSNDVLRQLDVIHRRHLPRSAGPPHRLCLSRTTAPSAQVCILSSTVAESGWRAGRILSELTYRRPGRQNGRGEGVIVALRFGGPR